MSDDQEKTHDDEVSPSAEGVARSVDRLFSDEGEASDEKAEAGDGGSEENDEVRLDAAGYPIIEDLEVEGMSDLGLVEDGPEESGPREPTFVPDSEYLPIGQRVGADLDPEQAKRELKEKVQTFLANPSFDRSRLSQRITGIAHALRDQGEMDAVAECIETLAGTRDDSAIYLARTMLTPSLAAWITTRLGLVARDDEEREARLEAVAHLGEEMSIAIAEGLIETDDRAERKTFIDALVALGDDARTTVEGMLNDGRWFVVRNAVLVLREIGDRAAIGHFTVALAHEDARVRREALLALAHLREPAGVMLAVGKLDDRDEGVRRAAAFTAGRLQEAQAFEPVMKRLEEEPEEGVQIELLLALGRMGNPEAVKTLERSAEGGLLRKPSAKLRIAAYRALAMIGTPEARSVLEKAVKDRDREVREAVEELLAD